ncbi:MAG: hypothetical protein GY795_19375, partial [Desulfobacterales bacterium]|nr:hypothetical protein [Desulfobacterales bacterium]
MTTQEPYNQRTLNLQAAEFYKSIRKEKSKWKSMIDLSPMLAEFRHYIAAGDYEKAFYVFESIYGHLTNWTEYPRIIEMGETMLSQKDPFMKFSEAVIMKIKAKMSWACIMATQMDKAERLASEARTIANKLLAKGPSDGDDYISACENVTMISNCLIVYYVFSGSSIEKIYEITKENEERLKNFDNPLYHASRKLYHGWVLQLINDFKAPEMLASSLKLFDEVDEKEMDLYYLNEKQRNLYILAAAYADKGQIEASFEFLEKSRKINENIQDCLFEFVFPAFVCPAFRYKYVFKEAQDLAKKGVTHAEKYENLFHLEKNTALTGNMMRDKGVWNIFVNKSEPEEGEEKPYKYQKKAFTSFQAAIDIYQNAAEIANTLGVTADESMLHGKIGNIYCRLGDGDPGLFVLAEENLKKALDLAQSDTTKYGTCLNLGRLYVYEAGKI